MISPTTVAHASRRAAGGASGTGRSVRAVALALIVWVSPSCHKDSGSESLPHVSVGIQVSPAMALLMVAKDQGLFARHGVEVELKPFTAGKFALQALLGGSLDFAVCGDVPIALAAMQGNDVQIVSQVVGRTINEVRMIARRDEDATSPARFFNSKRRKLATSFGGGPEFYTYSFLRHFGIDPSRVEIISQKPEDMPATLASRSVDAIAVFDPFAYLAQQRLGNQAVVYGDDTLYSELYVLAVRPALLHGRPEVVEKILRALITASTSMGGDPDGAKRIVEKHTKLDRATLDGIWRAFDFRIGIRRQLIDYWTAEVAWARDTGKVSKGAAAPRFESLLAPEILRRVDPAGVEL